METKTKSDMNNKLKETHKRNLNGRVKLLLVVLLFAGGMTANAQIGLPPGGDNIPDAPIDGFLAVGLIAGACIGLRKRIKGMKD